MDEVASLAGVTKPIIYQHFASKRALYNEIVTAAGNRLLVEIAAAAAKADNPRQRVELAFAAFFNLLANETNAFKLLLMSDMQEDRGLALALRAVENTTADLTYNFIEADIEGEHRMFLATAVVGMCMAVARQWLELLSQPDSPPPPTSDEASQMARRLADLAWAGLRAIHRE